jgi:hypothetical protein
MFEDDTYDAYSTNVFIYTQMFTQRKRAIVMSNQLQDYIESVSNGSMAVTSVTLIQTEQGRNVHPLMLSKDGIGILVWSADEMNSQSRWCIKIPPWDMVIHTVVCLCGCQQKIGSTDDLFARFHELDAWLQDNKITTILVRSAPVYVGDFRTRFIEAGEPESLNLIKDWPIQIVDRRPNQT